MLATVDLGHASRFRVEGDIDPLLIEWMRERYGDRLTLSDGMSGNDSLDFHDPGWSGKPGPEMTPASSFKFYRELNELTQRELAVMVGETRQHVSDMEHGRRPISLKMAKALSSALGAPLPHLI